VQQIVEPDDPEHLSLPCHHRDLAARAPQRGSQTI